MEPSDKSASGGLVQNSGNNNEFQASTQTSPCDFYGNANSRGSMEIYTDLRDKKRFKCNTDIFHDSLLPGMFYPSKMLNFSTGGLSFVSDQLLYTGDYINIGIKHPDDAPDSKSLNQFGVEILWRTDLHTSSLKYGYGAKFVNPNQTLEKFMGLAKFNNRKPQRNHLIDEKDPRKYPRRPFLKTLSFISKNRKYEGKVANVSRGGAFIETKTRFSVGQIITIIIREYKERENVKLKASVVRLSPSGVGVIFDRRSTYKNRRSDLDRRTGADRRSRRRLKPMRIKTAG